MMKRRDKSFMIGMLFALFIVILLLFNRPESEIIPEPQDFYATSREVSLDEFTEFISKSNKSIYLPSKLPNNFQLTAIYLKEGPFIGIIVYSAEGNKDYKTAELAIEIAPSAFPPKYDQLISEAEQSEYKMAMEINDWPVLIDEMHSIMNNEEFRKKYGDYTLLVQIWIEDISYDICCPTINTEEAIELVGNMRLLTT